MVSAQLAVVGERRRSCATCGRPLASKGHYPATFRSLFGDVPVRVRRLLVCPCHGPGEPKSFAAVDLGAGPAPIQPSGNCRSQTGRGLVSSLSNSSAISVTFSAERERPKARIPELSSLADLKVFLSDCTAPAWLPSEYRHRTALWHGG